MHWIYSRQSPLNVLDFTVEVLPTIGKTQDREDANESYFCCSQHAEIELTLSEIQYEKRKTKPVTM